MEHQSSNAEDVLKQRVKKIPKVSIELVENVYMYVTISKVSNSNYYLISWEAWLYS